MYQKIKFFYFSVLYVQNFNSFEGAQAWDIRRRVYYAIQACMGS
jgi:hypothetical protein